MRSSALVPLCLLTWTLTTWDQIETSPIDDQPVTTTQPPPCYCVVGDKHFVHGDVIATRKDEQGCRSFDICSDCEVSTVYGPCPPTTPEESLMSDCSQDLDGRWYNRECTFCTCIPDSKTLWCGLACPRSEPILCMVGFSLVSMFDLWLPCCTTYECRPNDVCVVDGAVYQPGDRFQKSLCETCQCTDEKDPETSLNQVSCLSLSCISCPLGFQYKEEPDTCCPECEQVACVLQIDDTDILLKPGDVHRSNEKCTFYTCNEDFSITNGTFPCPRIGCAQGYKYIIPPGHCCGTCVQAACVLTIGTTTTVIEPGDTYPSNDGCITCTEDFKIEQVAEPCPQIRCAQGYESVKKDDQCCPTCVQVACVLKDEDMVILLKPGEKYTSTDGCTHTCKKDFSIEQEVVACAKIACPEGTLITEGCCPKCVNN